MAGGGGAERARAGGLLPPARRQPRRRESRERLSVCSKLCYAVGGAPYQITGCALGFFLQIYLLDVAQLDPFSASIILFVGRAWDAVTDPMVGFFISKTSWTRFGRLMPCKGQVPPAPGPTGCCTTSELFLLVMLQCFHVPYSALTMFISREQSERDSATAYRMTVEVLGTVLGTAIQGQIVGKAVTPCIENALFIDKANSSVAMEELNMTHDTGSLTDTRNAYMIAAGVIGGLYILCAVVLSVGVREKRESSELRSDEPVSFFRGLKLVMNHGAYIKLIAGFLFTSLAFMLLEGNFALFCTYTLGFRNEFQNILLAIMLSATLTIPLWQWFLTRFGKKMAVYVGISSAIPFLIMVAVLDSNLIVTYIVAVAAGISVAAAFLLPWSMLPDVIDDFKLQHPDSHGHEAIFFSFYVFFTKFTSGVSLGISTLSLDFAGYQTRGCSQPSDVNFTLKMLVSAVPVGLILLGLLLFKLYPIDEEKRRKNKKALQDLREESNSSSESDNTELASIV
uniref:MFSD2 lysolipid transporter A, lysophospholipid n=1 Tax=Strigops habroptila TaxID=2489341 RepID=A0A672V4J7_STRHB